MPPIRDPKKPRPGDHNYKPKPVPSWFKKGISGNPKGRRRRVPARDVKSELEQIFLQEIDIGTGKRKKKVTAIGLIHQTLLKAVIQGDVKAAALLLRQAQALNILDYKDPLQKLDLSRLTEEEREHFMYSIWLTNKARVDLD